MEQIIIAIDPGGGGGIAHLYKGRAHAVDMPKTITAMNDYFQYLKSLSDYQIVFIEKVQAWGSDADSGGKNFNINKMLKNYTELLSVITLAGFQYVEVMPQSWQGNLKMEKIPMDATKTYRKNVYKKFAQQHFHEVKVTLKVADALCLIRFGVIQLEEDIHWVIDRLKNKKKLNQHLF